MSNRPVTTKMDLYLYIAGCIVSRYSTVIERRGGSPWSVWARDQTSVGTSHACVLDESRIGGSVAEYEMEGKLYGCSLSVAL